MAHDEQNPGELIPLNMRTRLCRFLARHKRTWLFIFSAVNIVLSACYLLFTNALPLYLLILAWFSILGNLAVLVVEFVRARKGIPANYMDHTLPLPFIFLVIVVNISFIEHTRAQFSSYNQSPFNFYKFQLYFIFAFLPMFIIEAIQWGRNKSIATTKVRQTAWQPFFLSMILSFVNLFLSIFPII